MSTRSRSCEGKRAHDTKQQAEGAITWMRENVGATDLVAYHCRFCQKWHTGHPFGPIRRKRGAQ